MNLGEYADFVCSKIRMTDSDSLNACKDYLSKRYELIYQKGLWRSSLIEFTVDVDADDALNAAGIVQLPKIVDRIVALRTPDRALDVENAEIYFRQTSDQFALTGTPINYNIIARACYTTPTAKALTIASDNAGDGGSTAKVRWIDSSYNLQVTNITLSESQQAIGTGFLVEAFTKDTTTGTVTIYADAVAAISLGATETSFEPYHRVRLIQKPQDDFTLRVLAKKKFTPLTDDTDEPFLLNVDNCLIAFAQADMLERQRQYAKAASKMQEAIGLLSHLETIEMEQQASNPRLIPFAEDVTPGMYQYESKGYW